MPMLWGCVFFLFLLGFPFLLVVVSNRQDGWLKIAGWILAGAFTLMLIVSSLFMLAFKSHKYGGCNPHGFMTYNCQFGEDGDFFKRDFPQTKFGDFEKFEIKGEDKVLFYRHADKDGIKEDGRFLPIDIILKSLDAPKDFAWVREQLQKMPKDDLMRVADFLTTIEPIPPETKETPNQQ